MNIEFKRLTEIDKAEIVALMNNPLVRRQMPLMQGSFDEEAIEQFVAAKEKLWADFGYGPWAFVIDNRFAGWGGLQPEHGEADLALVLHPDFWGIGKALYRQIIERAFTTMGLESVTVLLPPTRTLVKALFRLGFRADGATELGGVFFNRYRLDKPGWVSLEEAKTAP